MTLPTRGRHVLRGLAFAGVAAAGYMFGITNDRVDAQPAPPGMLPAVQPQPGMQPPAPKQLGAEHDRRVVGYLYGNVPITREELGDFLISRGGHEKLELLANKRIIEIECQNRGITITTTEIKAGLEEDLRSLGISLKDFEEHVLPRYHKTLYEWVEDVIKPRILLTKMCRANVKVTDEDVQKTFENRYGERRQAKIICWSKEDQRRAQSDWAEARKGDADFDRIAKTQADPNLAAACGRVKPVGRHVEHANDAIVVKTLFSMQLGEISGILEVPAGLMCIKCEASVPKDDSVKLDEKMRTSIYNELFQRKLDAEIPKCFQELKGRAKPHLLLTGPPSAEEFRQGVRNLVNQAGGVPPGSTPVPSPVPGPVPMPK